MSQLAKYPAVMPEPETTAELFEKMRREAEADRAQGIARFDGGSAWPEFSKRMAEKVLGGLLEQDWDD